VLAGYAWDGPSGPTLDTRSFMVGAMVHDVLYQAIREGYLASSYRKTADSVLYRLCREAGMPPWRAWYVHHFVRWCGAGAVKAKAVEAFEKILEI